MFQHIDNVPSNNSACQNRKPRKKINLQSYNSAKTTVTSNAPASNALASNAPASNAPAPTADANIGHEKKFLTVDKDGNITTLPMLDIQRQIGEALQNSENYVQNSIRPNIAPDNDISGTFQISGGAGIEGQVLKSNGPSSLPSWTTIPAFSAYGCFRCGLFQVLAGTGFHTIDVLITVGTPVGMSLATNTKDITITDAGTYLLMYNFNVRQTTGGDFMSAELVLKSHDANNSTTTHSNNTQTFTGYQTFQQNWHLILSANSKISFGLKANGHDCRINASSVYSRIMIYRMF